VDSFGSIGPDKGEYAADVRKVARLLRARASVYVPLAAKATKLNMLVATRAGVALPFADWTSLDEGDRWVFVAVDGHGAAWFQFGFNTPGYVADKLSVTHADGDTISEFLARLAAELTPPLVAA
jgi:hypothetical protein